MTEKEELPSGQTGLFLCSVGFRDEHGKLHLEYAYKGRHERHETMTLWKLHTFTFSGRKRFSTMKIMLKNFKIFLS